MSCCFVFFFKQKTAYEMRISDWSSDVCSSDLAGQSQEHRDHGGHGHNRSIGENLPTGRHLTGYNRQHRHPGIRIVRLDEKSERPEMRRCPEKDKREERKWERRYVARRGYPADQGRKSASSTADNDVLGRPALDRKSTRLTPVTNAHLVCRLLLEKKKQE